MAKNKERTIGRIAAQSYWREADARVIVEAWRRSGLSVAAFARRHGLTQQRVAYWRMHVGATARPRKGVTFHRVQVRPARETASTAVIEILVGAGCVVRVPGGVAPADVQVVLAAVGAFVEAKR
jgi:transposase-like protein